MEFIPLKSPRLDTGVDLVQVLDQVLTRRGEVLQERDILIVASKVVSYAEGRLVPCESMEPLVRKEADKVYGKGEMLLTLKNKILIPNAGIDQSNAPMGQAILWPEDPFISARRLRAAFDLTEFGVLITDSTVRPLRRGVSGIAIGWAGFEGVQDKRGSVDLYGRKLKYTQLAVADQLASAAELLMGNTNESIPFVIARGADVVFTDQSFGPDDYWIDPSECLYRSNLSL
ncbi:MAG: coenzyme F420-0:L-glutamate ligase [Candidatus Peregrinibacteria bacterium]